MTIPTSGRVFWTGAHAGIPANWTRDTDFDDKFLEGAASAQDPGDTGGATSHNHTANTHTHTGNVHTHTFSAGASTGGDTNYVAHVTKPPPPYTATAKPHSHNSINSNSTAITYDNTVVTINSTSDVRPEFMRVIVIGPDDGNQDIPQNTVALWDGISLPSGWELTDGGDSRPNMNGKFMLGMTTGGDGGGTGGSNTHTHIAVTHTHTADAHTHSSKLCGDSSDTLGTLNPVLQQLSYASKHHNVTLTSTATGSPSSDVITVNSASSEPAYLKLLGIHNSSGGADTPDNVIIGYVGTIASIPSGWELYSDAESNQIKITTSTGEIGDTSGSDTHTHTTVTHTHTHSSHTHGSSVAETNTIFCQSDSNPTESSFVYPGHGHTWTIGSSTPTLQNTQVTMSTDDVRYSYRTILFIKKTSIVEQPAVFYGCNF